MFTTHTSLLSVQNNLIAASYHIYPIQNDSIRDIHLPNSVFYNLDKEAIAVGLGYVCHTVMIISQYLYIPLRYPLEFKSSRSMISDPVSPNLEGLRRYLFQVTISDSPYLLKLKSGFALNMPSFS
jgi:hypothetical protein